jgi:LmbE family N-acetylglucosaminyl deacetylase
LNRERESVIYSTPQKALVLAPHPDDESLGCGGTIKLITSSGGTIDVLFMTRGEMGLETVRGASQVAQDDLARRRTDEALEACRILGVRKVHFLAGRDSHLEQEPDLWHGVWQMLQSDSYRSVFCPWHSDNHADHAATFQILLTALRCHPVDLDVWLYEVWTPLESNLAVPIDSTIQAKLEAILAHRSQRACADFPRAFRALAQYRSLLCPLSKYAEAFVTLDREQLIASADAGRIPRALGERRSAWIGDE